MSEDMCITEGFHQLDCVDKASVRFVCILLDSTFELKNVHLVDLVHLPVVHVIVFKQVVFGAHTAWCERLRRA